MTREIRAIFLALLTLFVYAGLIFFTDGSFIFPYPINELIFAAVVLQFCYWERHLKVKLLYPVGVAFLAIFSTDVSWEIILNQQQLEQLFATPWPRIIRISFLIGIVFSAVAIVLHQDKWQARFMAIFGMGMFITGYALDLEHIHYSYSMWYSLAGALLIAIGVSIEPKYEPFNYLWILIAGLELTHVLTYLLA